MFKIIKNFNWIILSSFTCIFLGILTFLTFINEGFVPLTEKNILNKLPVSSSNLYAKNLFNFVSNLYDKENKKININLEDEIINKTLVK